MADSAAVHCVAFRGFVILLKLEYPRNADSCARIWLYRYTNLSQTFVKVEKTIPLGISGRATVAKFECVLDKTSGLTRPCLLVHQLLKKRSGGAEVTCHVLFLSDNFESFLTLGCVNVRDEVPPEDKLKLFDGPCVCWSIGTSIYLISPDFAGNLTLNSHMLTDLIPNMQPDSFVIYWCVNLNGEVVAMGTTQTLTNGTSVSGNGLSLRWTCISLVQGGITVQDMCFIPAPYVSIVTCASVITRHHRVHAAVNRKLGGRLTLSDVAVFVATNQGQLLEFNNGRLRNCCRLPFVDPCNVWILEVEYNGEAMLLIQSKSSHVCAVNGSECKVVREWTGITSVLSEDFLGTGTEQLLLSHNGFHYQGKNDPLSHFTLVDIRKGMQTINSKQDFHGEMAPRMEVAEPAGSGAGSLQKTAQALGTRLQVGLTSLAEAQVECNEKLQLIQQSCAVLQNATSVNGSGQEIPLKSPGHLVSLLDGNFTKGESSCPVSSDVSVMATATWQRVIDDNWVVAADVKNSGNWYDFLLLP